MQKEYKATIRNHLLATWRIIVLTALVVAASIWLGVDAIPYIAGLYLFLTLPSILLYAEYCRWNANTRVVIDDELGAVTINDKVVFRYNDITAIIIYQSHSVYRGDYRRLPSSKFSYVEFVLNNGKVFFFTSLLTSNILKALDGRLKDKVIRKPRTWASMYMENSMLYKVFYD